MRAKRIRKAVYMGPRDPAPRQRTDGGLLQVDWIGDPGWTTGPDHVHPHQEDRFEVISVFMEGPERDLKALAEAARDHSLIAAW
jgi:hypothetical protein